MSNHAKRAVLYARVSDRSQAENEVSIPAQIEVAERRVIELEATLERVFRDEGRSAFKANNRREFEAAVEYAVTAQCDYFITWSSSRFARNKLEAALFKAQLDRAGVTLIYLDMDIDRSTDAGWMMDGMLEVFDEMKSRQTAMDTKRSLMRNAGQGYYCGGPTPYGFRSVPAPDNPKRRRLEHDPEAAARVLEIFQMRLAGLGAKAMAARFNQLGVRFKGRKWKKDSILHVLRSPAMVGQTVFNRIDRRTSKIRPREEWVVVDSHEPIVPRELWDQVQAMLDVAGESAASRGTSLSSHPFTGFLRCATCGGTLVVETATGRGGRYSYYKCNRARKDNECDPRRWPAPPLDEFLQQVIFERILDRTSLGEMATQVVEAFGEWQREQRRRRKGLAAQLDTVRKRNANLYSVLEEMGRDAPNLGDIASRLRENNAEIKGLEREILDIDQAEPPEHLVSVPDIDELAAEMRSIFTESTSVARLRAFYQTFIAGIVIREDSAEVTYIPSAVVATGGVAVHRLEGWGG